MISAVYLPKHSWFNVCSLLLSLLSSFKTEAGPPSVINMRILSQDFLEHLLHRLLRESFQQNPFKVCLPDESSNRIRWDPTSSQQRLNQMEDTHHHPLPLIWRIRHPLPLLLLLWLHENCQLLLWLQLLEESSNKSIKLAMSSQLLRLLPTLIMDSHILRPLIWLTLLLLLRRLLEDGWQEDQSFFAGRKTNDYTTILLTKHLENEGNEKYQEKRTLLQLKTVKGTFEHLFKGIPCISSSSRLKWQKPRKSRDQEFTFIVSSDELSLHTKHT